MSKHGPFSNCTTCGYPIDHGGFCKLNCKGGDAGMVPCTCVKCQPQVLKAIGGK